MVKGMKAVQLYLIRSDGREQRLYRCQMRLKLIWMSMRVWSSLIPSAMFLVCLSRLMLFYFTPFASVEKCLRPSFKVLHNFENESKLKIKFKYFLSVVNLAVLTFKKWVVYPSVSYQATCWLLKCCFLTCKWGYVQIYINLFIWYGAISEFTKRACVFRRLCCMFCIRFRFRTSSYVFLKNSVYDELDKCWYSGVSQGSRWFWNFAK